ncbi:MAG: crossover junction endodeoxyribonuclease RuvC [Candidatus Marinimicrobia bacterium]|nr:crossover junction endodeoxyribonuclease RuvC [Candidatus Neomarinimicrobiota bacterium]OUW50642.1 MAG: crossover junction endodeoxyribonuclease RuvC [bacterium TMED190]|tara:strand:- start:7263 stop:7730 length:468 start_codon:yes stop_codon:yes gene_type:complete
MLILGIDPGISITGYGILDYSLSKISLVDYGIIKTSAKEKNNERLYFLFNKINELLNKFSPDQFAIEEAFYAKNIKSTMVLSQARAVISLAVTKNKIPLFEYSPKKIKMSVVGNGNASKEQVKYMVSSILSMKEKKEKFDVYDALAIGICHIHQI